MSGVGNAFRAIGRGLMRPVRGAAALSADRPMAVLGSLGVVVVLLGVLSGFIYQQQHHYDVVQARRQAALATAKEQAVALLSYRAGSVEQELRREREGLTGQFKQDYTTLVQQFVAPAAKQQQITTQAEVAAASVMAARPDQVDVLLFIDQSIASKATKQPQRAGSRVRMILDRVDGQWLVSKLEPV